IGFLLGGELSPGILETLCGEGQSGSQSGGPRAQPEPKQYACQKRAEERPEQWNFHEIVLISILEATRRETKQKFGSPLCERTLTSPLYNSLFKKFIGG